MRQRPYEVETEMLTSHHFIVGSYNQRLFLKVLVANRGEIAVRILRALRELGIPSVAVYSEVDRTSLHVRRADEAVFLPSGYLSITNLLEAAAQTGATAIHPGYGFLSENAAFAAACRDAGITFIGPPPEAITGMGLKTEARRLAKAAGVTVVPGADASMANIAEAREVAAAIGYPVMLKAAAGGGGKGMRVVRTEADLEASLRDASSEAERSFSNGAVYIEKLIERPRHIEVQIFGDQQGNYVHLGERECSVQRRHQKVIEESPSPLMSRIPELRARMGEAAIRAAKAAGYYNAGTVEFLADDNGAFYFLEMNTRLQVEHPVTELVTGRDLVHLQLQVASGQPLGFTQDEVTFRGAAIECRICAEDPDNNFMPSPGRIGRYDQPSGPGVRVDSGVYAGWTIPVEYDPLLAKLIVWGETREQAILRMSAALDAYLLGSVRTNTAFLKQIITDSQFRDALLHTGFIEQFLQRRTPELDNAELAAIAALLASIHQQPERKSVPGNATSSWLMEGRKRNLR